MNYKEKYKEALERAKKLYEQGTITESLGYVFPELQENEDERIRKGLIKAVSRIFEGNKLFDTDVTREEALAWLEKQGKQPTDKIDTKFKVGDCVVSNNNGEVWQIGARYTEEGQRIYLYNVNYVMMLITLDELNNDYHLWTIKDASDGDILVNGSNIFIFSHISKETRVMGYCHVNVDDNKFYIDNAFDTCFFDTSFGTIDAEFIVATKEQRALLFQKMKEEGYEWDADKKELKKIEPKKLNPDEVIAWLVANICDFEYYVELLKKDFGLTEKGGEE